MWTIRTDDADRRSVPVTISVRTESGVVLCARCVVADTPLRRLRGLLGRRRLARGEGMLLRPASSIHTCGMRFAIDAVFLDGEDRVLRVVEDMRPWRLASCRGARSVLELPAGTFEARALRPGGRVGPDERRLAIGHTST